MPEKAEDWVDIKALEWLAREPYGVSTDEELLPSLAALLREVRRETRLADACIAGGHTGPGNTLATAEGYSNACREISATLRAKP